MKVTVLLVFAAACARAPSRATTVDHARELVTAVRAGDTVAMKAAIDDGVSADTLASDGTRPLTEAARNDRIAAATVLLRDDARLDLADSAGYRPIDYAVEDGFRGMTELLVRRAAISAGAEGGALAWFDAVAAGRAPVTWTRVLDGALASLGVIYATLEQRNDLVSAMRHAGSITNPLGYPPLLIAARFDQVAGVDALLQAGANPDATGPTPRAPTALMEAALDGYVDVGRSLLRGHAHVDATDHRGDTALWWAVRAGETDYARMLIAAGADPGHADLDGDTPIAFAKRVNHGDLMKALSVRR